jgi:XRE family transcriptional regulator, regulator of sulfur utilization
MPEVAKMKFTRTPSFSRFLRKGWETTLLTTLACAAAGAQTTHPNQLAQARVFHYSQMTPHTAPNGAVGRSVFSGRLATGETVAAHETTQPAGTKPNPPHRIHHSEIVVIQQGTVEFLHDGKAERASPGSIIYVAYNTLHTVKNVGNVPARYVVIQIGGDTKP